MIAWMADRHATAAPMTEERLLEAALPSPEELIQQMRNEIRAGRHWFEALLETVRRWRVPEETIDGERYRYLIGGEAFDWLRLAERLVDAAADLIPPEEAEALLFEGRWPIELPEEEFAARIGPAKHAAHLNFLYGVLVEQALQLSVEEELHKEASACVWGLTPRIDRGVYERIYGKPPEELRAAYYEETGVFLEQEVAYDDLLEFTYWLFKYRLRRQEKARVASDTRKGLAQLSRMELAAAARRQGARLDAAEFVERFVLDGAAG